MAECLVHQQVPWRAIEHVAARTPERVTEARTTLARLLEAGLADLVRVVREKSISSIAVPQLGCGSGVLDWAEVKPLLESAFEQLPDVDVRIFPPRMYSTQPT